MGRGNRDTTQIAEENRHSKPLTRGTPEFVIPEARRWLKPVIRESSHQSLSLLSGHMISRPVNAVGIKMLSTNRTRAQYKEKKQVCQGF